MAWGCVFVFGKDALISNDGTDAFTEVVGVAVAAPVRAIRIEVDVVEEVRVARIRRRRPVGAFRANTVELAAVIVITRSGQEDAIAIVLTGEHCAIHAIKRCPLTRAIVMQLLAIFHGRHTPSAAPLHIGNVVQGAADVTEVV